MVENSHALVGKIAEETIRSLYADICFFSSQGISDEGIITDYSEDETRLRKEMLSHSGKSVFLYDNSKAGKRSLFKLCHIDDLYMIINDD